MCAIAGVAAPDWFQGESLPIVDGAPGRERMVYEWESQLPGYGMHLRSVYRDSWVCTIYEPSTGGQPSGLEAVMGEAVHTPLDVQYDGTEGELYNWADDPTRAQPVGLTRSTPRPADLSADLHDTLDQLPVRTMSVAPPHDRRKPLRRPEGRPLGSMQQCRAGKLGARVTGTAARRRR